MNNKKFTIIIVALLIAFAVASVAIFLQSYKTITSSIEKSMGQGATDLATLVAGEISLTDADVNRLKSISYAEIPFDEKNIQLESAVGTLDYTQKVQCVYLMAKLDDDEVVEYVTDENSTFFNAKAGTPLNVMWLLDVSTNEKERAYIKTERGFLDYYNELERYSFLRHYETDIFKEKKPTYVFAMDEYGRYITGYSPVYSEEGNFVGMIGVDIHQGDYIEQKNNAFRSVIVSFLIVLLLLGIMVLFLYHKYTKADRKAKFVDALTLAHNRRYINEILYDQLNGKKFQKSKYLLYMMIDYDYFKNINDTYGHFMGDACLKIMKPSFAKASKGCPGQISRFGGEEFFAVVGVKNVEQAKLVAENLRKNIESSDPMNNGVHISISIGAFTVPYTKSTQATVEKSIRIADKNLYDAKASGRNCVHLTSTCSQ